MSRHHKKNQHADSPPMPSPVDRALDPNALPTESARAAAGETVPAFDESHTEERRTDTTGSETRSASPEIRRRTGQSGGGTSDDVGSKNQPSALFNLQQAAIHGQFLQTILHMAFKRHSELTGKTAKKDGAPPRQFDKNMWYYAQLAFWYPLAVLSNFEWVKNGARKADGGIAWLFRSGADVTSQGLQKIGEYYQIGEAQIGSRTGGAASDRDSGLRRRVSGAAEHSDSVKPSGASAVLGTIVYAMWHTAETAADFIQHPQTHWNQTVKGFDSKWHAVKENSKEAAHDSWQFFSSTPVMEMPQRIKAAFVQPDSKLRQSLQKFWSFSSSSEPQVVSMK